MTTRHEDGITPSGIAYTIMGEGDPLLLVSGYLTPSRALKPIAAAFAERFTTISYDYRGTGRSRSLRWPVTTGSMAGDAAHLLGDLGFQRAHVYGLSLGGMVAQELAIQHPDRVHGLVLGSTTPGGWQAVPAGPWTLLSAGAALRTDVAGSSSPASLEAVLHAWAAATHDAAGRLRRIQAPTLILHGDKDVLVPRRNAWLIAERVPNSELWMLEGQGHLYLFEDKEKSTRRVMKWLGGLAPSLATSPHDGPHNPLVEPIARTARHVVSQLLPLVHARRSVCPSATRPLTGR